MAEKPRSPKGSPIGPEDRVAPPAATSSLLPGFPDPKKDALSSAMAGDLLSRLGLDKPLPPKLPPGTPTIGPAPESTLWRRIQSANLEANTPLQWIDKMADATIGHGSRELFRSMRGLLPDIADRSMVIDTGAQTVGMIASMAYWDFPIPGVRDGRPGDQQFGAQVEASVQRYLEKTARPTTKDVDDVVMANGWKFTSGEIMYNGKLVRPTIEKPLEIENMLAIFVRTPGRDGKPDRIEILDPSTKVKDLKELPKLIDAMVSPSLHRANLSFMKTMEQSPALIKDYETKIAAMDTDVDRRWREVAGATGYIGWQFIPMIVSGGSLAAGKGALQTATKLPTLADAAENIGKTAKTVAAVTAPFAAGNAVSGLSGLGGHLSQSLYFSPAAIDKLSASIASVITDPTAVTAQSVRDRLNSGLHDKTYKEGSNAAQYYIPSLRKGDSPWERLQEALLGSVTLRVKDNNPWQDWSLGGRRIAIPEVKAVLAADPKVTHTFYSAVSKHLGGKPLTDQEVFVLRVGYNLSGSATADLNPMGKERSETGFKFSAAERKETFTLIEGQMQERLRSKVSQLLMTSVNMDKLGLEATPLDPKVSAKILAETGVSIKTVSLSSILEPNFTKAQMKAFADHEIAVYEAAQSPDKAVKKPAPAPAPAP